MAFSCREASSVHGRHGGSASAFDTSTQTSLLSISGGRIAGYVDGGIYTYKGIPYAVADRFQAPKPAPAWEGVRSCRAYGPTCPQGERSGWQNDEMAFAFNWDDGFPGENCLRVNVWTPGINDGGKRPVMVWLHGGGYSAGSGQELPSYDGANLARKGDVVVVSLNHRLNVLGFLDLSAFGEKYADSGNAGLLDLVEALRWVKENIAAFGGDPSNVTIFGQSGGGGKVCTLMATPSARGLFHKAIVQSGAMLRTMESRWSRRIGTATVEELGLKPNEIDRIGDIPYKELLAAGERAVSRVRAEAEREGISTFIFGWAPTVDGNILPAQPFDGRAPEQSKDIPLLTGTTKHEFSMSTYVSEFRNFDRDAAVNFLKSRYGDGAAQFAALYEEAYPGSSPLDLIDADFVFRPGTVELANLKCRQGGAEVYTYMFSWESPALDGILRSTHCMEIPFVFDNALVHASMTGGTDEAVALADKMSQAWIHFARSGRPYADGLPEWPAYNTDEGAAMIFDNECEVRFAHDRKVLDFVRRFPTRGF